MGPRDSPETSVSNHITPRSNPEDRGLNMKRLAPAFRTQVEQEDELMCEGRRGLVSGRTDVYIDTQTINKLLIDADRQTDGHAELRNTLMF